MKNLARLLFILALAATISCGTRTGEDANPKPTQKTAIAEKTTTTIEETTVNKDLGPALISAANRGDAESVRRLLEQGANIEARDDAERTPLIAAAYGNHLTVAEILVEAGADVNAKDETVQSAYLISTSEVGDDPRLLELTLEDGADVKSLDSYNGTGLIRAAERGYPKIVDRLLKTNIDVDHVNNLDWTALLEAIILGDGGPSHTEVVRLLIQKGNANPNLPDGNGVTPLQHARQNGYTEIEEILTKAGAK